MTRFLFTILIALLFSAPVLAQEPGPVDDLCREPTVARLGEPMSLYTALHVVWISLEPGDYQLTVTGDGRPVGLLARDPCFRPYLDPLVQFITMGTFEFHLSSPGCVWLHLDADLWPVTVQVDRR